MRLSLSIVEVTESQVMLQVVFFIKKEFFLVCECVCVCNLLVMLGVMM